METMEELELIEQLEERLGKLEDLQKQCEEQLEPVKELLTQLKASTESKVPISTKGLEVIRYSIDGEDVQVGICKYECRTYSADFWSPVTLQHYNFRIEESHIGVDNTPCFYIHSEYDVHDGLFVGVHFQGALNDHSKRRDINLEDFDVCTFDYDEVRISMRKKGLLDEYDPSYTTKEEMAEVVEYARENFIIHSKGCQKDIGARKEFYSVC